MPQYFTSYNPNMTYAPRRTGGSEPVMSVAPKASNYNSPQRRALIKSMALSVLPLGRQASLFTKVGTGIKNVISRSLTNPFAGVTVKQFGKSAVKKVAGIYSVASGFELVRSAQAGDQFQPLGKRTLQTALGFAISNPLIGGLGAVLGIGQRGVKSVKEKFQTDAPRFSANLPSLPNMPSPTFNVDLPQFQTPTSFPPLSGGVSTSYTSPSISISGGGGGGIPPELLALLIAGIGGYALGRRKRKKKAKKYKSKKRKR